MDTPTILQIVSTVGFPIAACFGMGWYFKYTTDKEREERVKMNEQHRQEMQEVTIALNNNTLAIQKLCDKIDG